MPSTKTTIRRLACTVGLVLTVLAFTGGVAGAQGHGGPACTTRAQDCLTGPEFRALTVRSLALNHKYGLGE